MMVESRKLEKLSVQVVATSYPRSESDWQGLFIKCLVDEMAEHPLLQVQLWSPKGPAHRNVDHTTTDSDRKFLQKMTDQGGIAHLLRNKRITGASCSVELLYRLRSLYQRSKAEVLHINWLQNAIPLIGLNRHAVITVLGTDFQMLKIPSVVHLLRAVLKTNRCVIAPNASWMKPRLLDLFGDLANISTVNFGIDPKWYDVGDEVESKDGVYLCVSRVTEKKMGPLFEWSKNLFSASDPLHLVGPNQEQLTIPRWIEHHGPLSGEELAKHWFPKTKALISLSNHAEGRPQVMLEAMAAGIPIIASSLPAHQCTVEHNRTGYLLNDQASFIKAIRELDNTETRRVMSKRAKSAAINNFGTWNDCIERYIAVYEDIL